jgi:hypothetical protein
LSTKYRKNFKGKLNLQPDWIMPGQIPFALLQSKPAGVFVAVPQTLVSGSGLI